MKELSLGLVAGRHEIDDVDEYIFDGVKDVFDFADMQRQIHDKLCDAEAVTLYVTGLSVCLVEVMNYCIFNNVNLTLMHYDRESDTYVAQETMCDTHYIALQESGVVS
ncbi:hypothetical protein [Staphylococcus americanisciuri]|uniref:SMODS-associated and fused to various effectors domain-containing protein n=1 Tax=Staphylococcus americanisciuri TaxID=2973940 RepID=A0ABT2F441_9STAP|nr:hypothetical protein [Staphylococcus americanisciuri]MCS4487172.1 hypothetical protein [Staphylococcus americanisciuri]